MPWKPSQYLMRNKGLKRNLWAGFFLGVSLSSSAFTVWPTGNGGHILEGINGPLISRNLSEVNQTDLSTFEKWSISNNETTSSSSNSTSTSWPLSTSSNSSDSATSTAIASSTTSHDLVDSSSSTSSTYSWTATTTSATSTTSIVATQSSHLTLESPIKTRGSFVTQEALSVEDTSFSVLPNLQKLLSKGGDYADVFDKKLLVAAGDVSMMSAMLVGAMSEQTFDKNSYVESVSKHQGKPFLYTGAQSSRTKKNCYIIRSNDGLTSETRAKVEKVIKALGGNIKHSYESDGFTGFTVCFAEEQLPLSLLKSIKGLSWVERDQFSTFSYVQENAPWDLSRLNNINSPITESSPYYFNATGKGVNVYAIDSGAMLDHPEFGGRAKIGFSVFGGSFPNDCAGHGTQVSSVIAGTNVGVAKLANIISVQVLDCDGQGENSSVLAALNWVITNHIKPAVINMSVGGPKSPSVDDAVRAAVAIGIPVVVAAGNSMIDACDLSPSGVNQAMVVGASTAEQERASFSNYGTCVDLFAPGRHVIAAAIPGQQTKNGFTFVSGTSLSAPLVTGLYALLLEKSPGLTPIQLKETIIKLSVSGLMNANTLMGSPNLLAQAPVLAESEKANIEFLPPGTLPIYGAPSTGPGTLEVMLILFGAILVPVFLILILAVLFKRYRRKRAEKEAAKFASAFH